MKFLLLLSLLFFTGSAYSQTVSDTSFSVSPGTLYQLRTGKADAVVFAGKDFGEAYVIAGNDSFAVTADPHAESSVPVIFHVPQESFYFYSGKISGPLKIYFLHMGKIPERYRRGLKISGDPCSPVIVPPSSWRSGLSDPSGTPSASETTHIIVHHSAGSNNISDPYQVVRAIYTQHTQVNGWSDIGYNYLIAPDGTIFQGRDSKGLFDPDYTIGAHMCGKNTNTMGICLLGTFTSVPPTQQALESLYILAAWKGARDNIDLLSASYHPVGPSSANEPDKNMFHISGHRDGCSAGYTECPGDHFYPMLPQVRTESAERKDTCKSSGDTEDLIVYPNPAGDWIKVNLEWTYAIVYDIAGRRVADSHFGAEGKIDVGRLETGLYILRFITEKRKYNLKFLKR